MKIAFVAPGFSADENDWCIPAHTDIARELARRNDVHVFAMRYPHRVDEYRIGGASVHSFNGVGSRGMASARLWKNVLRALAREHARARFDVVHAIFGSEAGCVAAMAGKFLRVPSVVWLVNGELVGLREIGYGADLIARQRWMNDLILRLADAVLCGCAQMAARARKKFARAGRGVAVGGEFGEVRNLTSIVWEKRSERSVCECWFVVGGQRPSDVVARVCDCFEKIIGRAVDDCGRGRFGK